MPNFEMAMRMHYMTHQYIIFAPHDVLEGLRVVDQHVVQDLHAVLLLGRQGGTHALQFVVTFVHFGIDLIHDLG